MRRRPSPPPSQPQTNAVVAGLTPLATVAYLRHSTDDPPPSSAYSQGGDSRQRRQIRRRCVWPIADRWLSCPIRSHPLIRQSFGLISYLSYTAMLRCATAFASCAAGQRSSSGSEKHGLNMSLEEIDGYVPRYNLFVRLQCRQVTISHLRCYFVAHVEELPEALVIGIVALIMAQRRGVLLAGPSVDCLRRWELRRVDVNHGRVGSA